MGVIFPPNSGCIQVTSWYADNVNDIQEVRFSVPASEWSKFEASDVYRNLVQYLESLRIQDTSTGSHEQECKEEIREIDEFLQLQKHHHESFLTRVRSRFLLKRKKGWLFWSLINVGILIYIIALFLR